MPVFAAPARVFTRAVSARYADCLRSDASVRIDLGLARAQHAGYVGTLRALGAALTCLSLRVPAAGGWAT
jgi:hypothetical protein